LRRMDRKVLILDESSGAFSGALEAPTEAAELLLLLLLDMLELAADDDNATKGGGGGGGGGAGGEDGAPPGLGRRAHGLLSRSLGEVLHRPGGDVCRLDVTKAALCTVQRDRYLYGITSSRKTDNATTKISFISLSCLYIAAVHALLLKRTSNMSESLSGNRELSSNQHPTRTTSSPLRPSTTSLSTAPYIRIAARKCI